MIRSLDPGHRYELLSLDGHYPQTLQYVKRCDLQRPWRFPGNTNAHPGTTLQSVQRIQANRVRFLQNQIWAPENVLILFLMRCVLWLLEFRAARRHGKAFCRGLDHAEFAPMCPECGHTVCAHAETPAR